VAALPHILVLLCYALPAVLLGLYLPQWLPALDRGTAVGAGVAVLLMGGLLQEVRGRLARDARLADQMVELRRVVFDLRDGLSWSRREAQALGEALEAVARSGRKGRQGPAVQEVMAEVKALKRLVERNSETGWQQAGGHDRQVETCEPAAAGGGATPAPPAAPMTLVPLPRKIDEAAVLDAVRAALRDDRIELALQPIVNLPPRKTCFYECFSRLRDKDGAMLLPEQYIRIAEREGLITAIDNMLLLRCIQLVRKVQRRKSKLGLFCNVSRHTLADEDFFGDFLDFLEHNGELAPNLVFEFAQGDFAGHGEAENRHIDRLAMLGCRFSVDQVRDAMLDLAGLARRGVRFVKVEAEALLAAAAEHEGAPGRLKRRLAREGVDLIVEKVESEESLRELLDHEIDYGQGFLFGEPRPARPAA
jgi:cyclic-di-GMP phosphodiesterase TipF (flagellum assembly factor)